MAELIFGVILAATTILQPDARDEKIVKEFYSGGWPMKYEKYGMKAAPRLDLTVFTDHTRKILVVSLNGMSKDCWYGYTQRAWLVMDERGWRLFYLDVARPWDGVPVPIRRG